MKKLLPYILIALALVATLFLLFGRKNSNDPPKVSTWITLSRTDKSPYGAYVFHNSLKKIFPFATINTNTVSIYENTHLMGDEKGSLYIIMLPFLEISEYELDELMGFVERGNNVFVSAFYIGYDFEKLIRASTAGAYISNYPYGNSGPFDMKQTLQSDIFKSDSAFTYPGQIMEGYFTTIDKSVTKPLGNGHNKRVNFVQLKRGKGNLFVHLSPISFSNYFLLYGYNHRYFEQIFSMLPANTKTIIWDEYFVNENRTREDKRKPGWFSSIMKQPSFRAGILTALALLLLYTIIEMRRRQRFIPVIKPPVNDSLEFVKTMGLLYHQRKDHQNLAHKMNAYFLEHVRGRYKIFTKELNENFVKELSYKSGVQENLVASIVNQIQRVNNNIEISDTELITLQRNIETFYKGE